MIFNEITDKKIWNLTNALFNFREVLKESIQNITVKDQSNDLIAVIGGIGGKPHTYPKTEVLDFSGQNRMCDLTRSVRSYSHGGAVFKNQIVLCGGFSTFCYGGDDIDTLKNSRTKRRLSTQRKHASTVSLNSSMIWIVGGLNKYTNYDGVRSTDFVFETDKKPVKGPELPISAVYHCTVDLEDGSFMLIGGNQEDTVTSKTWIISPSQKAKEGPPLSTERYFHACGTMKDKYGNLMVVVAGGRNKDNLGMKSVEILNTTLMTKWHNGKLHNLLFLRIARY